MTNNGGDAAGTLQVCQGDAGGVGTVLHTQEGPSCVTRKGNNSSYYVLMERPRDDKSKYEEDRPDSDWRIEANDEAFIQLFDSHAHQMPTYAANWIDELLADRKPEGLVLLGVGDVFTHQQNYSSIVHAFSNFKDVNNINFSQIESQLEKGSRGIGEVSIRHFPAGPPPAVAVENDFNEPDLLKLYDLADKYDVPVNFHFDYHDDHVDEIITTLPDYPEVNFIWAHAGDAQPEQLAPILSQLDNLYIDISCRNPLESFQGRLVSTDLQRLDEENGTIKQAWKELFTEFADRVLYGSDIGPKGRLEQYDEIQEYYRGILSQLDPQTEAKIAYRNAAILFDVPSD